MGNKINTQHTSEESEPNNQIDTGRIFSPECLKYPLTKFPSLIKIYNQILPKKFFFTLQDYKFHGFSHPEIKVQLHHSYLSLTDKKGKDEKHDYAHIHSWGEKKKRLSIQYLDAVDKKNIYIFKGEKKDITIFCDNILEIINLIVSAYQINSQTNHPSEPYIE